MELIGSIQLYLEGRERFVACLVLSSGRTPEASPALNLRDMSAANKDLAGLIRLSYKIANLFESQYKFPLKQSALGSLMSAQLSVGCSVCLCFVICGQLLLQPGIDQKASQLL